MAALVVLGADVCGLLQIPAPIPNIGSHIIFNQKLGALGLHYFQRFGIIHDVILSISFYNFTCMYVCMDTHICMYVCVHICMYVWIAMSNLI